MRFSALFLAVVAAAFTAVYGQRQATAVVLDFPGYGTAIMPTDMPRDIEGAPDKNRACLYPFPIYLDGMKPAYQYTNLVYRNDGAIEFSVEWNSPIDLWWDLSEQLLLSPDAHGSARIVIPAKLATPGQHYLSPSQQDFTWSVWLPVPEPLKIKIKISGMVGGLPLSVENGSINVDPGSEITVDWELKENSCFITDPAHVTFSNFTTASTGSMLIPAPSAGYFALAGKSKSGQTSLVSCSVRVQ